ncbi:hypothetical protein GQ600_17959 [Phytophthora cactorum]|nr:hypothetical protein GQ600_17959 [Phytophthora cactorum]
MKAAQRSNVQVEDAADYVNLTDARTVGRERRVDQSRHKHQIPRKTQPRIVTSPTSDRCSARGRCQSLQTGAHSCSPQERSGKTPSDELTLYLLYFVDGIGASRLAQ